MKRPTPRKTGHRTHSDLLIPTSVILRLANRVSGQQFTTIEEMQQYIDSDVQRWDNQFDAYVKKKDTQQ